MHSPTCVRSILTLLLSAAADAQSPPSADPALRSPGVDQVLFEQLRRERRDEAYAPATGGSSAARPAAVPDGTPFTRVTGRLILTDEGALVFEPSDASLRASGRLEILPGGARERLHKLLAVDGIGEVMLTGQFYGYRNRRLALVSTFARAEGVDAAPPAAMLPADPNPEARDLATRLESARSGPRALDRHAEATPRSDVRLRDGEILTGRTGRLVTGASGEPTLAFDNDPDSPALPALPIVHCRMRERLEAVLGGRAEGPRVRMSGRLLVENDRPHLLPTFFQVLPDTDLITRQ